MDCWHIMPHITDLQQCRTHAATPARWASLRYLLMEDDRWGGSHTCMQGGGEPPRSSGASSMMQGRPPVSVSPSERRPPPPPPAEPPPIAHAENAAVESALTLMMTSGLAGEPKSRATVASVGTPSGDVGSAHAQQLRKASSREGLLTFQLIHCCCFTGKKASDYPSHTRDRPSKTWNECCRVPTGCSPFTGMLKRTLLRFLALLALLAVAGAALAAWSLLVPSASVTAPTLRSPAQMPAAP